MEEQEMRSPEEAAPEAASGETRREGGDGHEEGTSATIAEAVKQAVREAALEVLGPAARQATSSAAKYAVSKGPGVVAKNVMPAIWNTGGSGGLAQQAISKSGEALTGVGGVAGIAGKLLSKLGGARGGTAATGWGHGRRMPVQQFVYCSVPIRRAYDGWTEYKQWPRYMHRANQVDAQADENEARVKVTEKMWGFKRPFTAQVVTQHPDEHIKWNSTEGTKHAGVINFHELGPRLTLIEVNLDHAPSGPLEKLARGARFVKRAVRADIHRFQGWIEMKSDDELEELEGWRGTIEDGRIVKSHEQALEEEGRGREEPEAREAERPGGEREEEPEAGEAGEPERGEEREPEAGEEQEPEREAEEHVTPRSGQPQTRARQPTGSSTERG